MAPEALHRILKRPRVTDMDCWTVDATGAATRDACSTSNTTLHLLTSTPDRCMSRLDATERQGFARA